jgi:hypothetical protein
MAGLLTYELVRLLTPLVEKRLTSKGARLVALAALSVLTITLLILLTVGMLAFFKSDTGNRQALLEKTNHILTDARTKLPLWIVDNWPSNVDAMKSYASEWVDEHSKEIQQAGKEVVHFFVRGSGGHGDRRFNFFTCGAGKQRDAALGSRSCLAHLPVR